MSVNEAAKWHWAEGMKYALEGIRMLLLLNGGAALSILTFAGNTKATSVYFVLSLGAFALGAAAAPVAMVCAYLTQLHYGNAESQPSPSTERGGALAQAEQLHNFVYWAVGFSMLFFALGIVAAAWGLLSRSPSLHEYPAKNLESSIIGRARAIEETDLPESVFPAARPYTVEQVVDSAVLPRVRVGVFGDRRRQR